jgi:hypothetical protein
MSRPPVNAAPGLSAKLSATANATRCGGRYFVLITREIPQGKAIETTADAAEFALGKQSSPCYTQPPF